MAGEEMDVFMLAGGLVGGAADVVIGNEEPELAFAVSGRGEVEGVGGTAVDHFGGFERVDAFGGEVLPDAESFHDAARGVGEGDFAAVVGRVGQGFLAALFDEQDVQTAGGGCGGEAEAGRAGADNDDIASVLHGEAPLGVAGKMVVPDYTASMRAAAGRVWRNWLSGSLFAIRLPENRVEVFACAASVIK